MITVKHYNLTKCEWLIILLLTLVTQVIAFVKIYKTPYQFVCCKFGILARVLFSRSFVKLNTRETEKSFCGLLFYVNHRESETSQIRLLTLFAKIRFSRKFPNLQYHFSLKLFSYDAAKLCFYLEPVKIYQIIRTNVPQFIISGYFDYLT